MKKYINMFLMVIALMLIITGCKLTEKSIQYYNDCKGDPECIKIMQQNYNTTHVVVSKAVETSTSSNGLAEIVGCVAGSVASFLTGVLAGKKLKKRG